MKHSRYWIKKRGEDFYKLFLSKFKTRANTCGHADDGNKVIQTDRKGNIWNCCLRCKIKTNFWSGVITNIDMKKVSSSQIIRRHKAAQKFNLEFYESDDFKFRMIEKKNLVELTVKAAPIQKIKIPMDKFLDFIGVANEFYYLRTLKDDAEAMITTTILS